MRDVKSAAAILTKSAVSDYGAKAGGGGVNAG
jgi:hypothetical protein